jgi:glycosyltransferase involved in cell wall biosynthesis
VRILISTIIRNRGIHIPTWCDQLIALSKHNKKHQFDLYVFENDSTDNTKQALRLVEKRLKPYFNVLSIEIEDCGWPYFGSIKAEERVRYLAKARNRTLDKARELVGMEHYDKVVCIEPDIVYPIEDISKLLETTHHIASGYSVLPPGHGVKDWIYDSWATRINKEDPEYLGPKISELPFCLKLSSTFNCFCVYDAKPFMIGLQFSDINPLTNSWDCDTTNICFAFAALACDDIVMYRIPILHKP